ncbi:MAG: hypothetical protein ACR2IK_12660 [Chloroflexota bacterium]
MTEFTRRSFITHTSIGVIGVGVAATAAGVALPRIAPVPPKPNAVRSSPPTALSSETSLAEVSVAGPMLVHVRDVATAEIGLLVGTQEIVYRDPELVARLVSTARQAGKVAG